MHFNVSLLCPPISRRVAFIPHKRIWGVYWSHPVCRLAVWPCVTKSCPRHNFKSIKASNFKLHIQIGHIEEKCSVQLFLAHLSTECSVSYCDHSPFVGVRLAARRPFIRPSIHNFLVNTLASTNINQSAPDLVKMYITIKSQISSIMELIGPELLEFSPLELENLPYLTLSTV